LLSTCSKRERGKEKLELFLPYLFLCCPTPRRAEPFAHASKPKAHQITKNTGNPKLLLPILPKKSSLPSQTAVQPYGAFVDIGAASDGLVHISHLSTEFVSSVADVVSQGQAVSVRVLSVDAATGKIALSMVPEGEERSSRGGGGGGRRDFNNDGGGDFAAGGEVKRGKVASAGKRTGGVARERRPDLTVTKGQKVSGKVARAVAYGVFVELAGEDGVQGFLHSEQYGETPASALEVGAELAEILVLNVDAKRRRVDLTLRSAEELAAEAEIAAKGANAGAPVPAGASPFGAAFARAGLTKEAFGGSSSASSSAAGAAPKAAAAVVEAPAAAKEEEKEEEPAAAAPAADDEAEAEAESKNAEASATVTAAPAAVVEAAPAKEAAPVPAAAAASSSPPAAAASSAGGISAVVVKALREKSGAGMMDCKKALAECGGDVDAAAEYLRKKGLASADKKASRVAAEGEVASYIHAGARLGVLLEVNCETDFVARGEKFRELVADLAMQVAAFPDVVAVSVDDVSEELKQKETEIESGKEDILSKPENMRAKIVEGRVAKTVKTMALLEQPFIKDSNKTVDTAIREAVAALGEKISMRRFERFELGEGLEKKEVDLAKDVAEQTAALEAAAAAKKAAAAEAAAAAVPAEAEEEKKESKPVVAVSAAVVKALREKSGAGMMDCKKALGECGGDVDAAAEYLRKKGLASADKKASRAATEGAIGSYIHAGSALGVLVEVNYETDFVARGEKFQELVADLAMQVAACPTVSVVSASDYPAELLEKERAIESAKEDLASKPENIRAKIVDGRVAKIAGEAALLEQPFIKDSTTTVGEHIKAAVASIGENIQVRRFARYNLGEGIEKRSDDFAAEVAAQTGGV